MQIKGVGVSTAGMMTGVSGIQVNGGFSELEEDMFGPEYEVTISEEGRNLSRQQTAQKEMGVIGAQNSGETRALLRQLEEDQLAEKKRQAGITEETPERVEISGAIDGLISHLPLGSTLEELNQAAKVIEEVEACSGIDWKLTLAVLEAELPGTMEGCCHVIREHKTY